MYIKTDGYGLINLKYCQGVEICQVPDGYKLRAIPSADSKVHSECYGTIAVFQDEADANYIASKLFYALENDVSTWDASTLEILSILWDNIKQRLQGISPHEALDEMFLSVSGENEVTIKYPLKYDADNNRFLPSEKEKVAKELNMTLKTQNLVAIKWSVYEPDSFPFP